jgi:hypothetical protein
VKLASGRPFHINQTAAYLDLRLRPQAGGQGIGPDEQITAVTTSMEGRLGAAGLAARRVEDAVGEAIGENAELVILAGDPGQPVMLVI